MEKYNWQITPEINKLVVELESIKLLFETLPSNPILETNLRRNSLLKSSVYSARIEGFTDTVVIPKKESQNLLIAYNHVFSDRSPQKVTVSIIKKIHKMVLKGLSLQGGKFRGETWAIFNQAGAVIYLAPPPIELPKLIKEYIQFINNLNEHPVVKSAIAQFIFEKIHPFPDGNGRVGRLISTLIINKNNYGFRALAPFEEYLEAHRDDYYYHLEPSMNCTGFIKFFLESLIHESKLHLPNLLKNQTLLPELGLLPRRREILEIIRDHSNCSLDFLKRRFLKVNPKTLAYDLSQLQKHGFVRKLGGTRGAVYISVE